MAGQHEKGVKRLKNAFFFSVAGLKATWKNEEAFRQEVVLFIVSTPCALIFGHSAYDKLLLIGSVMAVLLMELLNSALEAIVDRVGLEHHELSGRAKDIGSATVLLSMSWAIVVWVTLLV
jgi:diacylglycerol kinase (ATP)